MDTKINLDDTIDYSKGVLTLSIRGAMELLYYIFDMGYISHETHEPIHDLFWELKVIADKVDPSWTPDNLAEIVKKIRELEKAT